MIPYLLNILDLAFTLNALRHGAVELNPLMQCVPVMVAHKTLVTGALCLWLHHFAEGGNKVARYGLWLITAVYAGLCGWHLINIF